MAREGHELAVNSHWGARLMTSVRTRADLDSQSYLTLDSWEGRNQVGLRRNPSLAESEWDQMISIDAKMKVDSRFGWRLGEGTQISIVGQNLVKGGYPEFPASPGLASTMTARKVFGRVSWTF